MRGEGYLFVIWWADEVLKHRESEFAALLEHCELAASGMAEGQVWSDTYEEPGRPLHFVFQVLPSASEAFRERLRACSIEFVTVRMPAELDR